MAATQINTFARRVEDVGPLTLEMDAIEQRAF